MREQSTLPFAVIHSETTYLQIFDDLAHDAAEVPRLGDVAHDRRWQTDGEDEEVSDGEVDDEVVGDSAHARVAPDGEADETIADEPSDEDDGISPDQHPFGRAREDILEDHVEVFVI